MLLLYLRLLLVIAVYDPGTATDGEKFCEQDYLYVPVTVTP